MRTTWLLGSLVAAAVTASAADKIDISKLPPPAAQAGVTFEDIKPLLEASCVRCHSGEKPKEGLRLDTREDVLKGSKHGKVVIPGESAKSPIVLAASRLDPETAMPPKPKAGHAPGAAGTNQPSQHAGAAPHPKGPPPKPLTAEQVGLLRAWIDQGAK